MAQRFDVEEQLWFLDPDRPNEFGLFGLEGLPLVGGLIGGVDRMLGLGGGAPGAAPGGGGSGLLGGLGGLLGGGGGGGPGGLLGGILGGIPSILQGALGQGLGLGPAGTPGAGLVGAGLGGLGKGGTGPLPGDLGSIVSTMFGASTIPALSQAQQQASQLGMSREFDQLKRYTEDTGRKLAQDVLGLTDPALREIRGLLDTGQNQIAATAEHRNLANDAAFKNAVKNRLDAIERRVVQLQGGQSTIARRVGGGRRY